MDSSENSFKVSDESIRLTMLLRSFMTHGHLVADIDPLKLSEVYRHSHPSFAKKYIRTNEDLFKLLDPSSYGFT